MKILLTFLILSACSPKAQKKPDLPNYSDMSAAADAGRTPSAVIITNDN
jgi:hypothetical protein